MNGMNGWRQMNEGEWMKNEWMGMEGWLVGA